MSGAAEFDRELFAGPTFLNLSSRNGAQHDARARWRQRALFAVGLCWIPLLLLTIWEGSLLRSRDADSFSLDVAVHARFLIALPLFALAFSIMASRLSVVIRYFEDMGLVRAVEHSRYKRAVEVARRLSVSRVSAAVLVLAAYGMTAGFIYSSPLEPSHIPAWHLDPANEDQFSLAGWWHALVSLPMLLAALLSLAWRWCIWVWVLWRLSRLSLVLVAVHPDGAAGLGFVGYSVRAYTPHALLLGVIVAGSMANSLLYDGRSLQSFAHLFVSFLILVVVLFSSPLLVFSRNLLLAWRRGVFEYGALADRMGRQFEIEWLERGDLVDKAALSRPDFSATTDLYSIVHNLYSMRVAVIDRQSVLMLVAAAAVPFVPVVLMAIPVDAIFAKLAELLF